MYVYLEMGCSFTPQSHIIQRWFCITLNMYRHDENNWSDLISICIALNMYRSDEDTGLDYKYWTVHANELGHTSVSLGWVFFLGLIWSRKSDPAAVLNNNRNGTGSTFSYNKKSSRKYYYYRRPIGDRHTWYASSGGQHASSETHQRPTSLIRDQLKTDMPHQRPTCRIGDPWVTKGLWWDMLVSNGSRMRHVSLQ